MSNRLEHLAQVGSLEFGMWWLQSGTKLKPEGRRHYGELTHIISSGLGTNLSEHIRVLDGYDYTSNIHGLENLRGLANKNILLLSNHSHLGPLEGFGETLLASYYVQETTRKEIRWIRGRGKSLKENARQLADKSLGTIPVYDKSPESLKAILEAFEKKETVGVYPEGNNSIVLREGELTAGNLVLAAIRRNIPIISSSMLFRDDKFFAAFDMPFTEQQLHKIKNIKNQTSEEREDLKRKTIDYVMATIARNLPCEKRGHYAGYQEFINAFESLVTSRT